MNLLANPLRLSEEELTQVHQLAACNYSPEKIALYLDTNKDEFMLEWYKKDSLIREAYDRGQLQSTFIINNKQRELAESGNITAAQIFLKESDKTKFQNAINHCFFGA